MRLQRFLKIYGGSKVDNVSRQLNIRPVDDDICLIPWYPNDAALAWYQDEQLYLQVDNSPRLYTPDRLKAMYEFLSRNGDCFYIEYLGALVGDVTLRDSGELAIVICREYQNRHIGRRCIGSMLDLAREKGMAKVTANIYSFNSQSRSMFLRCGFVQSSEEWFEYMIKSS